MFGRKIRSVFDKLIPKQNEFARSRPPTKKKYAPGEKVYFKAYKNNLSFWEVVVIEKKVGLSIYQIQGPKHLHKQHVNQIRKRHTETSEVEPQKIELESPIDTFYESFDIEPPQPAPDSRRYGRKRKLHKPLMLDPKRRKY